MSNLTGEKTTDQRSQTSFWQGVDNAHHVGRETQTHFAHPDEAVGTKPSVAVFHSNSGKQLTLYQFSKRTLDVLVSACLLLLSLPLFLVIALCIKVNSRGPVFFKQRRLGLGGKEFWCYKFRTMVVDAEDLLKRSEHLRNQFQDGFKIKNDPRVTSIGAFLRKTSLDEIPQFVNVLLGDMSLIGPRPIVPPELSKYGDYADKLLTVKPGLSGMWQACGRSDTTYAERVQMDMAYIDSRSLLLDMRLILLTALSVVKGRGAY